MGTSTDGACLTLMLNVESGRAMTPSTVQICLLQPHLSQPQPTVATSLTVPPLEMATLLTPSTAGNTGTATGERGSPICALTTSCGTTITRIAPFHQPLHQIVVIHLTVLRYLEAITQILSIAGSIGTARQTIVLQQLTPPVTEASSMMT